jgi:DNA-binding XRE family transcriptional regulator
MARRSQRETERPPRRPPAIPLSLCTSPFCHLSDASSRRIYAQRLACSVAKTKNDRRATPPPLLQFCEIRQSDILCGGPVVAYCEAEGVPILDSLGSHMRQPVKKRPTSDAIEIIHRRHYQGRPERIAGLAEGQANDTAARKIFRIRKSAGLTQQELAKLVGTTTSVISRLEDADYGGHSLTTVAPSPGPKQREHPSPDYHLGVGLYHDRAVAIGQGIDRAHRSCRAGDLSRCL